MTRTGADGAITVYRGVPARRVAALGMRADRLPRRPGEASRRPTSQEVYGVDVPARRDRLVV
jgi:hypothetical protein